MRGIAKRERVGRDHLGCQRAKPRNRCLRLVWQPHVSITGRKKSMRSRENRSLLDRHAKSRNRFRETPAEEQRSTDQSGTRHRLSARAEPQGHVGMLDSQIHLSRPQSQKTADIPAACVAWVEAESAIYERDHRIDVFAETGKGKSSVGQDARVVSRDRQSAMRKLDGLLFVSVPVRGRAVADEVHAPGSC